MNTRWITLTQVMLITVAVGATVAADAPSIISVLAIVAILALHEVRFRQIKRHRTEVMQRGLDAWWEDVTLALVIERKAWNVATAIQATANVEAVMLPRQPRTYEQAVAYLDARQVRPTIKTVDEPQVSLPRRRTGTFG